MVSGPGRFGGRALIYTVDVTAELPGRLLPFIFIMGCLFCALHA